MPELRPEVTGSRADAAAPLHAGEFETVSPIVRGDSLRALRYPSTGCLDAFLERRFRDSGQLNLDLLANQGIISFLSKVSHCDEIYEVSQPGERLAAGVYRIRDEGAGKPVVTVKRHGNSRGEFAETIDFIDPDPAMINMIRGSGKLIAVIEKTRTTYKSKHFPDCLIHSDQVEKLGRFFDLKADSLQSMEKFVEELGLGSSPDVGRSYLDLKIEAGISRRQLAIWRFHERFKDYIQGVVSGTLTPLGFLTATVASGGSKTAMIVALASAGISDGLSDAVAASQTTQSNSKASSLAQAAMFGKTMLGKIVIPVTFVPIVLGGESRFVITALSAAWAALLLSGTASIQALAHERSIGPAVARLVSWGAAAVAVGTALGNAIPALLSGIVGH